jgi:hypothetical protein
MSKYLLASPDRYGRFGHQTTSIASALLLAHLTRSKIIAPRYMYFCDKWNKYSDFTKSKYVASAIKEQTIACYLEKDIADRNGNRKWNLSDKNEINDIITRISLASDNSIIHLPFDQSAGLLLYLLNKKEVRDDFKNIFSFPDKGATPPHPYACIHIRRGDCTFNAHPQWYVDDKFYLQLIELLLSSLPSEYKVYVCTQGNTAWLLESKWSGDYASERLVIRTTDQLFINESEINDFILMKNSNILFSAASSFSHWASYLGNHQFVADVSRSNFHGLYDTLIVNPDNSTANNMSIISNALRFRLDKCQF